MGKRTPKSKLTRQHIWSAGRKTKNSRFFNFKILFDPETESAEKSEYPKDNTNVKGFHFPKEFLTRDGRLKFLNILQQTQGEQNKRRSLKPHGQRFRLHPGNRKFVGLNRYVNVEKNDKLGRHIMATRDLRICEPVVIAKPFAAVMDYTDTPYCLTCHKSYAVHIPCENCPRVRFCSLECKKANRSHQYECGTNFHRITFDGFIQLKCAMQMVFETLLIFNNHIGDLMDYVSDESHRNGTIPVVNDDRSRFHCILNLSGIEYPSVLKEAQLAYQYIMTYPMIAELFHTDDQRIFLQHLLAHNLSAIDRNAFSVWVDGVEGLILYDVGTFFNHSCLPNVVNFLRGNTMVGVTTKNVHANEQLCISYDCNILALSLRQRRQKLRENFGFKCICERCTRPNDHAFDYFHASDYSAMSFRQMEAKLSQTEELTPEQERTMIGYYRNILRLTELNKNTFLVWTSVHYFENGKCGSSCNWGSSISRESWRIVS